MFGVSVDLRQRGRLPGQPIGNETVRRRCLDDSVPPVCNSKDVEGGKGAIGSLGVQTFLWYMDGLMMGVEDTSVLCNHSSDRRMLESNNDPT